MFLGLIIIIIIRIVMKYTKIGLKLSKVLKVIIKSIHNKLDGKYSERVQLPAKAKFGDFCRQHLATLATPTISSIKCKQSPVSKFLTVTSTSLYLL